MGLAYVAPIGLQNLFVINSALTHTRKRALLTALIVIFFDVTLALACFFGVGALMEELPWLRKGVLAIGSLIVIWMGIGLIRSKSGLAGDADTGIPLLKTAAIAFTVTWINPQALIDGTMLLGAASATLTAGEKLPFFKYDTPYSAANSFRQLLAEHAPLVLVFMSNFGHPITRTFVGRYAATYDELTGGSLALVVRSRADRLARSVGPDTLPYPLLCDADGVLYDLLDIPTRSGALSTYSLEAWQIMRDAKRRGYHSPANGQQQLPLTLVLDKDGTVLFSHYGASLTDVPADCGAAQSLLEDLDVAKPVDVDDADVTIYADPGAAPDIPGLTPHVHEYAQPNLGETGVFSVFDDAYKDEE